MTPKRTVPGVTKPRRMKRRRRMKVLVFPWRARHGRGAGALLGVLLLAALGGAALAVHYEARDAERVLALDRAAGRVFAAWVLAAHRAAQAHAGTFETALKTHAGVLLSGARLRALGVVPPGLPERPGRHATMVLGVIADGTARRVPMAFGVIEPGAASRPSALRAGALDAGLRALAPGGGSLMEAHQPAIEAALGRPLAVDALYVTADRGLHYRERALYRRAQPGRPWLNRMETDLAMAPPGIADPADPARRHIAGAGAVSAIAAAIGTDIAVGGTADIGSHAGATGDDGGDDRSRQSRRAEPERGRRSGGRHGRDPWARGERGRRIPAAGGGCAPHGGRPRRGVAVGRHNDFDRRRGRRGPARRGGAERSRAP